MSWKRLITSGSKAAIKSLSVNFDSDSGTGVISASNKIFALSAVPLVLENELDVVIISGSGADAGIGTFEHTGSNKFSRVFGSDLTISGDLKPNGGTFDGTLVTQLSVETGSVSNTLSGEGLAGGTGAIGNPVESINILGSTKPNLAISSNAVSVSSSLIGTAEVDNVVAGEKGIFYDTLTDKIGLQHTNNLKFIVNSGGGSLAKKAPNESNGLTGLGLTAANGINSTALNTFNYSANKVVIFDSASLVVDSAGSYGGLKAHDNVISIRTGSISLSNGGAVAIDGDEAFIGRIGLNDDGTTLTLGQVNEVVEVVGNTFQVQGTPSFAHETDLETADKFILVNSGSAPAVTQNFGYQGMNGVNSSIQMGFTASVTSNNLEGRGWRMGVGNGSTANLSNIKGNVRLHISSVAGDPNTKTFKPEEEMVGNTCRDSNADEADSLFMYIPNP